MAGVVQFERPSLAKGIARRVVPSAIDPKLKRFIDRVVVPILVREYVAEMESEKQIAKVSPIMSLCAVTDAPQAKVDQ